MIRARDEGTVMAMTDAARVRFGVFVTPSARDPRHPVRMAQQAERAGFDLVTFQDHPYQPAFLDTWTLLSYVAGVTSTIGISGNVLNIPLRQPAVLARAAVSLDLLAPGRVSLAIGAGGFWDAIVAMGEQRLSPGESVTAFGEAVDVIRGMWDTSTREPLRVGGAFHHVDGAKRGPAPTHPIPIWVGALGPRMLRLIGRKADGWLPSLGRLGPGDLERGNTIIDDAAVAAGRAPSDITRLLNVPADLPVDRVVSLTTDDRIGVFVVATDDPAELDRWAVDVIPEVRGRLTG